MCGRPLFLIIAIILVAGRNADVEASIGSDGEAVVTIGDREWQIKGSCESEGDDLTFIAPGDPMLSIGLNTADPSSAVGNFSSRSEGFGVLIGNPEVPKPSTKINSNAFTVSGTFLVLDGSKIDGEVRVSCG